ncbi:MAG: Lrp/AsnC family transcriptional regulator [Candidatus Bathyarchaeota archaeon]|nr:Lrp/AsnC family transcriptional regulator [Candidatus Bathyarchaeota archaeon]MDH5787008.1 Lrp/AsnC family transcriptional regulator [Candidatus Bathyarchaeota archaeon]
MDEKDDAIIRVLERRSKISSRSLSKIVGLPISTVHRRVQRLKREGVIIGYKALINYEKTNKPISALLLINLAEVIPGRGHIPRKDVLRSLKKFEEIEEVIEVQASNFDLVIKARLRSLRRLSAIIEELRSIEGIEEISSAIVTEEIVLPPPASFKKTTR